MKRTLMLLPCLILAVVLVAPPTLAEGEPQWRFAAGEELRYEVTQQSNIKTNAGPAGEFMTTAVQTTTVLWKIDSVDDAGVGRGVQKIERIALQISMPSGLKLNYDSASEEPAAGIAAMLTPMFETLLENEIPMAISPAGEVLEWDTPQAMDERLAAIPATRAMSEQVTQVGVRQLAEQIALPLTSDGRTLQIDNRVLGAMTGELIWKPSGTEELGIARFTPELSLTITPAEPLGDDNPTQPLEGASIERQAADGVAEFNVEAGRLQHASLQIGVELAGKLMGSPVVSAFEQSVEVTAK